MAADVESRPASVMERSMAGLDIPKDVAGTALGRDAEELLHDEEQSGSEYSDEESRPSSPRASRHSGVHPSSVMQRKQSPELAHLQREVAPDATASGEPTQAPHEPQLSSQAGSVPDSSSTALKHSSSQLAASTSPTQSTFSGSEYSQVDSRPTSMEEHNPADFDARERTESGGSKVRPTSITSKSSPSSKDENSGDQHSRILSAESGSRPSVSPESRVKSGDRASLRSVDFSGVAHEVGESATSKGKLGGLSKRTTRLMTGWTDDDPLDADPLAVSSHPPEATISPYQPSPPKASDPRDASPDRTASPQALTRPTSPNSSREVRDSRDSLESIALSEISLDYDHLSSGQVNDVLSTPINDVLSTPKANGRGHLRKPSSIEILSNNWVPQRQSTLFDITQDMPADFTQKRASSMYEGVQHERITGRSSSQNSTPSVTVLDTTNMRRSNSLATLTGVSGSSSEGEADVDWSALDATEEQEKEDKAIPSGEEDESTTFLLARLEQENAKFSADPKAKPINKLVARLKRRSRPPSMLQLKKLIEGKGPVSAGVRLSLMGDSSAEEQQPAMTDMEFWSALVQDYPSTAARLPTLTTMKVRAGVFPPIRGVVWPSMAGARDVGLEEAFDKLVGEKSTYEGIINKDVGRSFPGVELFRDAEGEGQKMLGRVLKCYSLFDKDIGYCQGLGFLVGPLLMNMGERDAFCVLVR